MQTRAASVVCIGHVECVTLDRNDFSSLLGPLQDLLVLNFLVTSLKSLSTLSELHEDDYKVLA